MSNITDSVFFGGLLCALGVIFINVAIKKRNRLRKTQDTQRTKVSSAQQGYVEIEGFAWPDFETVESSSGLKTIHHSLQIQRLESVGRSKHWWTIFTKIHNPPFYVFDGTGAIFVIPINSEVLLGSNKARSWKSIESADQQRIVSLMGNEAHDFQPDKKHLGFFKDNYQVVESEIYVGSPIYLHGELTLSRVDIENATLPGLTNFLKSVYDEKSKNLLNKNADFDTNRNGKMSAEEYKLGYANLARTAIQKQAKEKKPEKPFSVYGIIESTDQHQLFIADLHEQFLSNKLRQSGWLYFIGSVFCFALGTVLIIKAFI